MYNYETKLNKDYKMGKALIFSDMHLHNHKKNVDRLHDCLKVLKWILNTAVEQKCQDIFFLGDLFHERSKIDIQNYILAFEVFADFYEKHPDIKLWLIVGNHDMYHKTSWKINSIKPLNVIPNINIIEQPSTINIQDVMVDFLPYVENPSKHLNDLKSGHKPQLLLAHLAVHGATLNTNYGTTADVIVEHDDGMETIEPTLFKDWKQTFLGHYHAPQCLTQDGSVEYVGSPLELSHGEAYQDKHIIVFDMDTFSKTYIDNTFSPKHLTVTQDEIDKVDLTSNFVKVVVKDTSNQNLSDLQKTLNDKNTSDWQFVIDKKKEEENQQEVLESKDILKSDEIVTAYVETVGVPEGLEKNVLHSIGLMILEKGNNREE